MKVRNLVPKGNYSDADKKQVLEQEHDTNNLPSFIPLLFYRRILVKLSNSDSEILTLLLFATNPRVRAMLLNLYLLLAKSTILMV